MIQLLLNLTKEGKFYDLYTWHKRIMFNTINIIWSGII